MSFSTSKSLLHKLYNRELYGRFSKKSTISATDLFDKIPEGHVLQLSEVFENSRSFNHMFMGVSQCGRFLITYSITQSVRTDFMLPPISYTLHLWSFSRAHHKSKKVAEIILFSGFNSEIVTLLNITIAQWPTINDKIIVYGESEPNCPGGGDIHTSNTFLTIAHLPSLESCVQCNQVAMQFHKTDLSDSRLFPESDYSSMANTNRCLKHGLTVDAMFYLVHPHPKFDISINIKYPNTFLVNTGNFLHILSTELHNSCSLNYKSTQYQNQEENKSNITNDRVEYKIAQRICKNIILFKRLGEEKKKHSNNYLNFFINSKHDEQENYNIKKYSPCSPSSPRHSCSPPPPKYTSFSPNSKYSSCSPTSKYSSCSPKSKYSPNSKRNSSCENYSNTENIQRVKNIMAQADKVYAFEECEDGCELKFKWFRKRKLADKMYEFCSDEDEMEHSKFNNLLKELRYAYERSAQPKDNKVSFGRFLKIRLNPEKTNKDTASKNINVTPNTQKDSTSSTDIPSLALEDDVQTELSLKTDFFCSKPDNCDISSIISDWESQDTNSLSPKSDISNLSDFSTGSMPGTSTGIRFSLKNKKPRLTLKKYTRTNVAPTSAVEPSSHSVERVNNMVQKSVCVILKPQNRMITNNDIEEKETTLKLDKKTSDSHQNIHLISGCSFEVERHFKPNNLYRCDDVAGESDYCEDGNQVPISVRGPGCNGASKLQLVDESDTHGYSFVTVKQKTVDIEQFCFKAADLICKNEHFVFRSFNDYDVEVIDMCPFSGNVIAVVSIKMNAESVKSVPPIKKYSIGGSNNKSSQFLADMKKELDTCCVLIWNVDSSICQVEAYTPLKSVLDSGWNYPAQFFAKKIKSQNLGFFNVPSLRPRSLVHHLKKTETLREVIKNSMVEITDRENLVGFRLDAKSSSDSDSDLSDSELEEVFSP